MNNIDNVRDYILKLKNPEKRQYAREVMDLVESPGRKVAYHAFCTDGVISASLLKFAEEGDVFVPLDYSLINDSTIGPHLEELEWYSIIDLKPFNKSITADLYVDHHISAVGEIFNAKRVYFETGIAGPSAAYVLWKYLKNKIKLPEFITTLVEISKITDTASYKIPAPIEEFSKRNYHFQSDEYDLQRFHEVVWDVQDGLTFSARTFKPNHHIFTLLTENGLDSLFDDETIIKRINNHRIDRQKTIVNVETMEPTGLTTIVNPRNRNIQDMFVQLLTKKGAKIVVILKEDPFDKTCSVSLRQSKSNSKDEKEFYRLDEFAKRFNPSGGGHIEASGSHCESLEKAFELIAQWGKEKNLKVSQFKVHNDISRGN